MFSVVELDNTRTLVVCLRLNTTPSSSLNLLEKMKKKTDKSIQAEALQKLTRVQGKKFLHLKRPIIGLHVIDNLYV